MRRFLGLWLFGLVLLLAAGPAAASPAPRSPDVVLSGEIRHADHQTYLELPFRAPRGVSRLKVELQHDGAASRTVIDLGVRDPVRFRGWSGGARSGFEIGEADATPGYLPGPLPSGSWRVILGIPNARPDSLARYTVRIWFGGRDLVHDGVFNPPVREGAAWYRGDLHLHSAHSDGKCESVTGRPAPCPVFLTLEAARRAHLDFIALSDHNTPSQAASLRELAPYFDDLLVVPAREVTTFEGHANVYGTWDPLEFRLPRGQPAALGRLLGAVEAAGGLLAPNHPGLPSGEACMGCGWTAATDWSRIHALEVVSGGVPALGMDGPLSGLGLWNRLLDQGFAVTGIAGSDTHDPLKAEASAPQVGRPATVVLADGLSTPALLDGVRAGRVFLDLSGTPSARLDYAVSAPGMASVMMGGRMDRPAGGRVDLEVTLAGLPPGARLRSAGGLEPLDLPVAGSLVIPGAGLARDARWFRLEVVGADGRRLLIGNPVYLTARAPNR